MNYIKRHWKGQQTLAWSFWVNLVILRLLIFTLQKQFVAAFGQSANSHALSIIAATLLIHGLVLCWQIVGVIRAADIHFAERGNQALVWGAQLGAVLLFVQSALYGLEMARLALHTPAPDDSLIRMQAERETKYNLDISETGEQLLFAGSIELGATKRVRMLLDNNPHIRQVVLTSPGGNIYEARGLANEFSQRTLNTHVIAHCESACTVAFIGGAYRSVSETARIGFHQYRIDASYTIIATDVEREQRKDEQIFRRAGVDSLFIQRLFAARPEQMWWPTLHELQTFGVIHATTP